MTILIKNKILFIFTIFILVIAAFYPRPIYAAEDTAQTVNLATMGDTERLKLAKYLLENQQAIKAIQAISFKNFDTKDHIIIAQTILADSLFAVGKKADAIAVLRRVLSIDPELFVIRYKLAQMLFTTKDDAAAKHHFKILRASMDDENNQNVIDQYLKQMDLRKRWFFSVGGDISPQTNYNGGSNKKLFYCEDTAPTQEQVDAWTKIFSGCKTGIPIEADKLAKTGVVISGNAAVGYRFRLNENIGWTIRGTGEYTRYPSTTPDVITLALNSGPTISLNDRTRLNINGVASISIANKSITQKYYAGSATLDHVFSPQLSGSFITTVAKTENLNNDDYSNLLGSLNTSLQISIDNSSFVRLMGGVARAKYEGPHLSYWRGNLGAGYYKEFEQGITLYSEIDIAHKITTNEVTTTFNLNAKLSKRDFNFFGFTPQLVYNYNFKDSNISYYDTNSHRVSIGITRSF
ncbi:MAG: surface lipoprotein assembly modifier [Hyphomicrobiales bacterium]